MKKYITIIMVVVSMLLTILSALPSAARAQAYFTKRLTTEAEGVVLEGTVLEESDSQSDSTGWSLAPPLIESEVSFYHAGHGIGLCSLLTGCADPAVAKAHAENSHIFDLQAQMSQAHLARSQLIARGDIQIKWTNNTASPVTADLNIILEPIQLLTSGYCSTGPGAPTAVYNVELWIFWPDGQDDLILQTSGVLVGGTKDHNLTTSSTSGDELEATPFIPLPGVVGYEFDGFERHYDLGTLEPNERITAVYKLNVSAEGRGAEECSIPPTSWLPYWGAGAFVDGPFDNISLAANFYAIPLSGVAPLTVNFVDRSTGYITSWSWDFGDGSTSTERNPTHTYTDPGTYTVTLTVTDSGGSDTEIKSDYVYVDARPTKTMPWIPLLLLDE